MKQVPIDNTESITLVAGCESKRCCILEGTIQLKALSVSMIELY
jgi:hypothetical protein